VVSPAAPTAKRGEIWLAALDPTVGSEIRKTRPCLIVSPDELNPHLRTLIVAPLTTGSRPAPFRVPIRFQGKHGLVLPDRMRTLDRRRLVKRLGAARPETVKAVLAVLRELFAE
jgi:mRNA interferase MazF